jgi:hypothetical protein
MNYATLSVSYALELEGKLVARDTEVAALRVQLELSAPSTLWHLLYFSRPFSMTLLLAKGILCFVRFP